MTKELAARVRNLIPGYSDMESLPRGMTPETAKQVYYDICLIREFELRVRDLWRGGEIGGICHAYLYAEAIAVGACHALMPGDYITSTHRGHGHALARGASPERMIAELLGKEEGYNKGKGGSMHIADVESGILGATGIVGSGIAPATGAGLSAKMQKNNKISLCFFGDGATNQGIFFESLNMAAAWDLPVIYLCEYNGWAIGTDYRRVTKNDDVFKRGEPFGIPGVRVDGFNAFAVYEAVSEAAKRARGGGGPTLIEARYMRMLGHHVGDDQKYRDSADLESIQILYEVEPLVRLRAFLSGMGVAESELDEISGSAVKRIEEAITYAKLSCHEPSVDKIYEDVFAGGEVIR